MATKKLNIRFSPNQMLVLSELKEKLHCSYSVMVRSMVYCFLKTYEEQLEKILSGEREIEEINFEDMDEDGEE